MLPGLSRCTIVLARRDVTRHQLTSIRSSSGHLISPTAHASVGHAGQRGQSVFIHLCELLRYTSGRTEWCDTDEKLAVLNSHDDRTERLFLQRVSIACYAKRRISYRKSVCLSVCLTVCHTLVSSQNDSSYDHGVFTGG